VTAAVDDIFCVLLFACFILYGVCWSVVPYRVYVCGPADSTMC